MVSYVGDAEAQALGAAMWASIDEQSSALVHRDMSLPTLPSSSSSSSSSSYSPSKPPSSASSLPQPSSSSPGLTNPRRSLSHPPLIGRLAARYRRRLGLSPTSLIPGYNPCRRQTPPDTRVDETAKPTTPSNTACSDGLLCISPEPTPFAEHESGGCYPVRPSTSFVARTRVPPIPPTFRPEQATVYYYLNLVMPDDGNSDVTNSTKGYVVAHYPHVHISPC